MKEELEARARPSDAERMMRYDANKMSILVAYLLWFFFGTLGGHRFYMSKTVSGLILMGLWIVSILITFASLGLGAFVLLIPGLWALVDAFLIPGWVRIHNNDLIEQI